MNPPAKSPYRLLARGIGATQLWMAGEHLLLVRTVVWSESYRRFYFRDIQAILLVHTSRRLYWNLGLLGLAFVVLMISHAAGGQWISDAIIGAIFLPLLVRNNVLGSGCRVVLTTAVQDEAIPCLRRLRQARRVIATLTPLIKAAQLDLAGDSTPPVVPDMPAVPDLPTPAPAPAADGPPLTA
ncbi:MAG TPA: hypothetical protein VGM73_07055 [Candidatus Didemnitutus sp.]|jgi:hypothetical protein